MMGKNTSKETTDSIVPFIFPELESPVPAHLEGIVRFITPAEQVALDYNGHLRY